VSYVVKIIVSLTQIVFIEYGVINGLCWKH